MIIHLPRVAAKLKTFAEAVTATHDRAIELRQDATAATITAADGRQLCRIIAPPPEGVVPTSVAPFLVDARAFAKAVAEIGCSRTEGIASSDPQRVAMEDRPITVARVDGGTVAVAGPSGESRTVAVAAGRMPDCGRIIDVIRREAAVGGAAARARLNPRFLQNVADAAIAAGITHVEIAFAPRLNYVVVEGTGPDGCVAQFAIAGIGEVDPQALAPRAVPAWEADDATTFEMPIAKPRSSSRRRARPPAAGESPGELPF